MHVLWLVRGRVRSVPWFARRHWQREIKYMEAIGKKLELEALSNKHFSFITQEYLPKKLRDKCAG